MSFIVSFVLKLKGLTEIDYGLVFPLLSRRCTEEQGHERKREVGVVIDGRITMGYLSFTYTPVSTIEFCLAQSDRVELKANFRA